MSRPGWMTALALVFALVAAPVFGQGGSKAVTTAANRRVCLAIARLGARHERCRQLLEDVRRKVERLQAIDDRSRVVG